MIRRLLALTLLVAAVSVPAASATTATLRFGSLEPLVIRGAGFPARVRVQVTVTSGSSVWTRLVTTTAAHTFTVNFGSQPVSRCALVAKAFGGGVRISTKPAQTGCPEPIEP